MYRFRDGELQVLLVHPGGPLWTHKDLGAWSIPKGECNASEDSLHAAQREFHEETGFTAQAPFFALGAVRQPGGKIVTAWAFAGNCDPAQLKSNTFPIEWPLHSGRHRDFPEIDRAEWFGLLEAKTHILKGQAQFLQRLVEVIADTMGGF